MFNWFYFDVHLWGDHMAGIGSNIRELREAAGMSQDQLGKRIGKTRSAISQYESGKIVPRMGVIEDLAHVFRVPKLEIIGESSNFVDLDFGDSSASRHEEQMLLAIYRELPDNGKEILMRMARDIRDVYELLEKGEES